MDAISPEIAVNVTTGGLLLLAFAMKFFLFRRFSTFGAALSLLAGAMVLLWAYVVTAVIADPPESWRFVMRWLVILTCLNLFWQARRYYGGWRGLAAEIALGALDYISGAVYLVRRITCRLSRNPRSECR